jgi:hypothetical protein
MTSNTSSPVGGWHSHSEQCAFFSQNENAEQGARANDHICHVSCCRRSRASCGRGSSLTFGNFSRAVPMRASESIRFRGLAGTVVMAGVRFLRGLREAVDVVARRGRGSAEAKRAGGRHAFGAASSLQLSCIPGKSEACTAIAALVATRPGSLFHRFGASFPRRVGPPNKAPEPTPLLVTVRAFARPAPSSVVAHL